MKAKVDPTGFMGSVGSIIQFFIIGALHFNEINEENLKRETKRLFS